MASMDDVEFQERSRKLVEEERDFLFTRLDAMGLNSHPSQANFIFVTDVPGGGQEFAKKILRAGVIVRPMDGFGEPNGIRITVGLREQNEQLLKAVAKVLEVVYES
jgi:histidinol-phosphate aminotransferase